jgi:predicted ATPase/DNA-binding SARP family transcriptional activator
MTELRISLLGGFSAQAGGQPVPEGAWRLRKAKGLVKLLALAPEHRMHRERASELLWPGRDSAAAANNLHQAMYVARRAFEAAGVDGAAALELRDEVLVLGAGVPLSVDADEFEQSAGVARGSGDRELCRQAVELYAGELLPEDRYEDWAVARRDALRELCSALLLELADLEEREGDSAAAVRWLQRALVEDPLHEEAHRRLMSLFALVGRRQQALAQYQQLRQALRREYEDVPDPETRRLYRSILSGDFGGQDAEAPPEEPPSRERSAPGEPPGAHNLPLRLTSFVGRERELGEVWRLLERGRLVTLTGPGGCGKTSLALEAAAGQLRSYADGIWLVELAPLSDPALLPDAVAEAVGVRLGVRQTPTRALAAQLSGRQLLLVLDNCEHMIDACARLAEELLRSCPDLTILATSREPLHLPGEFPWRVPSLSLPSARGTVTPEQLLRCEAGRLFVERAAGAAPGFELDAASAPAVAETCLRLDGMPLALELAAARVNVLSPAQIAERLGDSLQLLAGGSRTALTRQQTLRATLAWSHDLLTSEERTLFRRLAAFSGSFALDAIEGVCAGDGLAAAQLLDLLGRLVDKSLVQVEQEEGQPRYRLLETIRQYASERLDEAVERAPLERRHRDWFSAFAAETVPPLAQAATGGVPRRLDLEHDNLRAALASALHDEPEAALRLAVTLWPWWLARSHFAEGARFLHAALARVPQRTPLRAEALLASSALHVRLGDAWEFPEQAEEAIDIRRELGDRRPLARALLRVGQWATSMDGEAAGRRFAEALAVAQEIGDHFTAAGVRHGLGVLACFRSEYADAARLFSESRALLERLEGTGGPAFPATTLGHVVLPDPVHGHPRIYFEETILLFRPVPATLARGYVLANHASALRSLGDPAAARDLLDEALALWRELADPPGIGLALNQLGNLGRSVGEHVLAREWLEEALQIRRELGDRRGTGVTMGNLGLLAAAAGEADRGRALLGDALVLFERTDDGPAQAGALQNLANLELGAGRRERARDLLEQSLALWEEQQLWRACGWLSLMLADLLADESEAAGRARTRARELFTKLGDAHGLACLEEIKPALRGG